jgi:hypothetical protein
MGQKGAMPKQGGLVGPRPAPGVQSEMEMAMAAGMGLGIGASRSPFDRAAVGMAQSPFERAQQENAFAREFQQQFRGAPPPNILGPRGHAAPPVQEQWINDFQRMNMRGDPFGPQSVRAQGWGQEMARGPPPQEFERAWRQQNMANGQGWANEMAKQEQVS